MTNEISEIHQKVDDRQRKSCRAFIQPPKLKSIPFSLPSGFSTVQVSSRLKEKSSIVEIQIPPKSWEF